MDLTEFLLARIAEEEEVARALLEPYAWGYSVFYEASPTELEHIARHDPARVLAECAAKRAIIEFFAEKLARPAEVPNWIIPRIEARQILVTLAQPDAAHPDFRPEWALVKA